MDVFAGDVIVAVALPKSPCFIFADELIDDRFDQSGRVRTLEFEHVALRQKPVAEVDAFEHEWLAIRRYELLAVSGDEFGLGRDW